jgi:Xaa-Pro dipeptidase
MPGKISASINALADDIRAAGAEGHHLVLGPGPAIEAEWTAAGLELPDVEAMRDYRIDRVRRQLEHMGYDGAILWEPANIRYCTDSTNMQIWTSRNPSRYCWVGADGSIILWEFFECDFLSAHNPHVDEVRPATSSIFFIAGTRYEEKAKKWAAEMLEVIREHSGENPRIAIDYCGYLEFQALAAGGVTIENGLEMMEMARHIKGPDEIKAMRCAIHSCQASMGEMRAVMEPGMTERELWAMLHAGNIRRGGEWIETQILSSGPRTNPWMQEASSRVIENGDVVAYDTDLVGAYGMMCDISRSWIAGDAKPTAQQQQVYELALHQIQHNSELLTPGRTFRELTFATWKPPIEDYRHYCVNFHGVGQCDEYPEIFFPHMWENSGFDGVLEPGMVLTTEAFVGSRHGGEGIKLEDQYLVTESGPELLSTFPVDLQGP